MYILNHSFPSLVNNLPQCARREEVFLFTAKPRSVPARYSATLRLIQELKACRPVALRLCTTTSCLWFDHHLCVPQGLTLKHGTNVYLHPNSITTYVLPAPPGYWVPAMKCEVWREPCNKTDEARYLPCQAAKENCKMNPTDSINNYTGTSSLCRPVTFNQPCSWQNNPALLGKSVWVLPIGAHDEVYPFACGVGLLGGNGLLASEQTSAACAGLCPAGFTCGKEATVAPEACLKGHYCPKGTSAALPCLPGSYSVSTNLTSAIECMETDTGHFAPTGSTEQTKCSPGTVQPVAGKGACDKCEAGKYQADEGEQACVACEPGSYCPVGASAALPCKEGTYSDATNLTGPSECTESEAGHFSPTGSTEQTKCSPGTVQPMARRGTCVPCAAGSFMNVRGQSVCLECPAGSVCAAQATAAVPCPGGTFGGSSGLRGFSDCEDAPPGNYSQAGSVAPTPCPSWGFCPGRVADQVNDVPGSIPIVIPEGQQTTTVTKVVEQAINQTVLELPLQVEVADVNAFNDTAVRLRVADMLGLPLHAVSLSFAASRRRLDLRAARSRQLVALDFVVTITDEPGVNITSANTIWTSKSPSTLSAELGLDVTDALSPVVATKVTVRYVTVSTLVVVECPAGSWGANGVCVRCPKGTYEPGGANGAGCLECLPGTYQPFLGATECSVCGTGNYSANTLSCEPCPVGEYCPEGSVVGKSCPIGSTTEGNGAVNYDDCGCPAGMFDTAAPGGNISCTPCDDDHMLCTRTSLTLATVPLYPARWRLSVNERHI